MLVMFLSMTLKCDVASKTTCRHGLRPLGHQALERLLAAGAACPEVVVLDVGDNRPRQRWIEDGQGVIAQRTDHRMLRYLRVENQFDAITETCRYSDSE